MKGEAMYNYNSKFWIYTVHVENMKRPDVNLVYGSSEDVIQYMLDDMHDDASSGQLPTTKVVGL